MHLSTLSVQLLPTSKLLCVCWPANKTDTLCHMGQEDLEDMSFRIDEAVVVQSDAADSWLADRQRHADECASSTA